MFMSLSDFWNGLQDRYYAFLDGLEEKGVPVYKIVDPIDRYLPSLALWLVLALVIVGLLVGSFIGLIPGIVPEKVALTVTVRDSLGLEQEGALVKVQSSLGLNQVTTDGVGTAKFLVGKNDKVTVEVSKEGFAKFTGTMAAEKAEQGFQIELKQEAGVKEVTISLTDLATGALLTGKQLTVSFYCDNPLATSPASKSTVTGKVSVDVPEDCGELTAKVISAKGDYEADSVIVSMDSPVIRLEGLETAMGTINVNTQYNEAPIDDIVVRVYNPAGTQVDFKTTVIGQATFSLPAGSYYVLAEATDTYKEKTSSFIELNANETETVTLALETGVIGSIELTLKDEATTASVSGATVRLMFGNDILSLKQTGSDGKATFAISEDKTYKAAIDHKDYELKTEPGLKVDDKKTINLKKFNPSTMRKLYVKVINEEAQPIENSKVSIFNAETEFLVGLNDADTNADGMAMIQNLTESGKYYAFAFKGNAKGKSDDVYVDLRHGNAEMTVTLALGDGTIELNVLDNESKPVPFAKVNVIDSFDDGLIASTLTDETGKLSFTDKADKKVYLNVVKEGFMPHTTSPIALETSVAKQKTVQLIQRVLDPNARPRIEFAGLFKDDQGVTEPGSGQEYTAKLKLVVPEVTGLTENVYSTAGIVFRVGDAVITEKDLLFIKKVDAPKAAVFKFSAYYPDNQTDSFNSSTASDTKWVSIVYPEATGLKTGVYEVDVRIKIKDVAGLGDNLFFYYNAWGKRAGTGTGAGNIMTDPIDTDLGTISPLNKYAAFFESKQTSYAIGLQELCDQDWCFVARVTDDAQGLAYDVIDLFTAENFADYTLSITITNNSKTKLHTNANARIKFVNEGVMVKSFKFINADGQKTENASFNAFELPNLSLGAFTSQKRIQAELKLRAVKPINDSLRILIVSDQVPVLEKFVQFNVQATKQLSATIEPVPLTAGISNLLKFTVSDSTSGLRLGKAVIKIKDRFGNYLGTCELEAGTSGDCLTTAPDTAGGILGGEARIKVQSLKPGTRLIAVIAKALYATLEADLFVDGNVLEVTPKEIPFSLDVQTLTEASQSVELANMTSINQEITSIKLNGAFAGLIDEKKTNEALNALTGITLQAKEKRPLNFRVFISSQAREITVPRMFDAKIIITSKQSGSEWNTEVPVKISLGLGGQVDDATCFVVTKKEWIAASRGEPLRIEFEIENNCAKNAQPVTLRNIQAKVQPAKGANEIGYFTLTIGETEQELRPGFYKLFQSSILEGERITAVLTFSPRGGYYAGTSKADIMLKAENPTSAGIESLESKIKTEIDIVNLKECIGFDKEFLVVDKEGKASAQGSFTIETSKCKVATDFKILTEELKKFGVQIDKTSFSLQENGSQKVTIIVGATTKRGSYAVPIQAKPLGKGSFEDIRAIELKIIDSTACIELSKYEFDLYQKAGAAAVQDFTDVMIMPWCYEKKITISYEWDTDKEAEKLAKKFALQVGVVGGLLTGVGNWASGKPFWSGKAETRSCTEMKLPCKAEDDCADILWAGWYKQGQYGCGATEVCCEVLAKPGEAKPTGPTSDAEKTLDSTKGIKTAAGRAYTPILKTGDKIYLAKGDKTYPAGTMTTITEAFFDEAAGAWKYKYKIGDQQFTSVITAEGVDELVKAGTYLTTAPTIGQAVAPTTTGAEIKIMEAQYSGGALVGWVTPSNGISIGESIVIDGSGFVAGEAVDVSVDGVLATSSKGLVDAGGKFSSYPYQIPQTMQVNTTHTIKAVGTYSQKEGTATLQILAVPTTAPIDTKPKVTLTANNPTTGTAPLGVGFNGRCEMQGDIKLVRCSLAFGDGQKYHDAIEAPYEIFGFPNQEHTYTTGTYQAVLTAVNTKNETSTTAPIQITVTAAGQTTAPTTTKPTATLTTTSALTGLGPLTVNFSGGCTANGNVALMLCQFYSGDGSAIGVNISNDKLSATLDASNKTHTYTFMGTYKAYIIARNTLGEEVKSTEVTITVQ